MVTRWDSCVSIGLKTEEGVSSGYREKDFPRSCNQLLALLGWNDGTERIILTGRISRLF
jgi:hypothetical protein